eukprot:scaffold405_cov132-Cylindrotheca_fusiformis.AAC.7
MASVLIAVLVSSMKTSVAFDPKVPPSSSSQTSGFDGVHSGRRSFFKESARIITATSALTVATTLGVPENAHAAASDADEIEVYFGCGCFWHVQHELVEAERRILGRRDMQLTARTGYAGGKAGSKDGKVCYHNALKISDYGSLGHAEVVSLKIPSTVFPEFAKEYFALFNDKGYRPDQWGDVGSEYRNLVGFPGGVSSSFAKELIKVSQENGDKLDFARGKGDDPDARALCFVMDTADYPFFVAEQYHQFHDGFNWGENYPNDYNALSSRLAKANLLGQSQCPNGWEESKILLHASLALFEKLPNTSPVLFHDPVPIRQSSFKAHTLLT